MFGIFKPRFSIKFLDRDKLILFFQNSPQFNDFMYAYKTNHQDFLIIYDSRFEEDLNPSIRAIRDFGIYKFFHPLKMAGYKIGSFYAWGKKSVIISVTRFYHADSPKGR